MAGAGQPDWHRAKQYVLKRLEELPPNLDYHGIHHTRDDVLPAAIRLAELAEVDEEEALLLRTAALYHDIGFLEQYTQNEPVAVRIATETLPGFGFSPAQIEIVGDIIMATRLPQSPHNFIEELMCDADLDSLGRDDYFTTSHNLHTELAAYGVHLTLTEWYERQIGFLSSHSYFTAVARSLREATKQQNIVELKRRFAAME